MKKLERLTGVPEDRVSEVAKQFQLAGAVQVVVEEDPLGSGKFTISATFEDDVARA